MTFIGDYKTEVFYKNTDKQVVQNIQLTNTQKADLQKRIKVFEKYFNSLSKVKQDEIIKEKSCSLDVHLVSEIRKKNPNDENSFDTQSIHKKIGFRSFDDIKKLVADFKKEPDMKLTNEDVAQILTYTDTTDTIVDGKIGSFYQGGVGSCWYLSMLNNYASTQEGADNIASRIKNNSDGTYTVVFQDPADTEKTKEYEVSEEELKLDPRVQMRYDSSEKVNRGISNFSSGDKDVRLLEIATNKLLKDYLPIDYLWARDNNGNVRKDENGALVKKEFVISNGDLLKRAIVHKAMGYKGDIVVYQQNNKKQIADGENLAFSLDSQTYKDNSDSKIFKIMINAQVGDGGKMQLKSQVEPSQQENLVEVINENQYAPENLVCNSGQQSMGNSHPLLNNGVLSKDNRYLSGGHVFNIEHFIKDKENNTVRIVVNDPYNSQFSHPVSVRLFELDAIKNPAMRDLQYMPTELTESAKTRIINFFNITQKK